MAGEPFLVPARHSRVDEIHPGTVDTKLSKPYQRGVKPGSLFSGKQSAKYLLQVLNSLSAKNTGAIFSWDGDAIPY